MAIKKKSAKKVVAKKATTKQVDAKKASAKKASPAKKAAAKKAPVKKAADKASKPANPFGQKFIDAQEKRLLEERARYTKSRDTWQAEADSLLVDREPGDVQFDEESGDGDTLQVERERDLALSSYAQTAVEEINDALGRLKAGVYGMCVTSGKPIPKERLEAIPWAAERVEYKVAGFRR
ncbi:MAG: TraR/DksA family transcriptional regulator [Acidimicrobiales bacterium]|jgi:RNA polymerase-binding transcription factor DksA